MESATNSAAARLKGLDYQVLQQCMHCGLCLPVCPTYNDTKMERNSPRGRISLARAVADGRLELTPEYAREMYFCLGCLACTSACPAGVNYAEIFEHARAAAEEARLLNSPLRRVIRWFTVKWLFMDLRRLLFLGLLIRFYQAIGLQGLIRKSGVMKLFPKRLQELESMTPDIPPKFSADMIAEVTPAQGKRRFRVAMLTGCAQDLIFSEVNRDTVDVLARNSCEVFTPARQSCCGSLHGHNGEYALAQELARRNIDQFPPEQFDAIISNAGGCGSHLKHYGQLLETDAKYRDRAHQWDAKLKDIHEWLSAIGLAPINDPQPPKQKATYHESCHLCHGQKITAQPRQLLKAIPGLDLIELPESNWCCGSAGIYNITQPEMAGKLLMRKMTHIKATGAGVVANGNSGCLLQLVNGTKQMGLNNRVAHPVTLLAEAYRRADAAKKQP